MRPLGFLIVALAAACGRAGFNPRVSSDADIDGVPDAVPDAAPQIACGAPVRFSITGTPDHLSATATLAGYDVFPVEDGVVRGYAYDFATGVLAASHSDVLVADTAAGALGAFALGDDALVAMPYASASAADPVGTALIPLDRALASRGTPTRRDGVFGASASIASSAGGSLALLTQALVASDVGAAVSARRISPLGADLDAAPVEVVSADDDANSPTITAGRTGFLVTWISATTKQVFARLLDDSLQSTSGITLISVQPDLTPVAPRVAYAATADRYLFAWYEKVNSVDQIWASLRDGNLNPIGDPILVASQGIFPVIAASGVDFLVVWDDGNVPHHLGAARITKDGDRHVLGVASSGGSVGGWDLTVHIDRSALVWTEVDGTGPNLWIDPLCDGP